MRRLLVSFVLAATLAFPVSAGAQLQARVETIASKTASFQALIVEDPSPGGVVIVGTQSLIHPPPSGPPAPAEVRLILVGSGGFATPLPAGCKPYFADVDPNTLKDGGFSCPPQYDIVSIETGVGDDRVQFIEGNYRSLSPKQLDSRDHPIFMNVSLGSGDDSFAGGFGTDYVLGGSGKDVVRGDRGNDVLIGGAGRDHLISGEGRNLLVGGKGPDRLDGGKGTRDLLIGGRGRDLCRGSGKDRVGGCEKLKLAP